jgi:TonB family protein
MPVKLEIPDKYEPIQCTGIVVWSKPNGAAGIRFTTISESQKINLRSWLEDLEKAATSPSDPQQYDEFTSVVSKIRASQLNNADALNFILKRVSEITSASGAAISLGTPENMVCLAAVGIAAEVGSQVAPGKGLTSEAVLRRKMVHCQNTKSDPRVGANGSFGSAVILPLIVGGEVRGTLEAFSPRTYAFDSSAVDNLEKLADAVVFVTYGVVTQRRLLAVKTPGVVPPSTVSTTSTVSSSTPTVSTRSPAVVPPRPQPAATPSAALTGPTASTSSFATPTASAAPAAAPVAAPRPTVTQPKHVPTPRANDSHLHLPRVSEAEPPRSHPPRKAATLTHAEPARQGSSAKWIALVFVLLLGGAAGWYFLLRPKTQVVSTSAPAATVNTPATQPELHNAEPPQVSPSAKVEVASPQVGTQNFTVPAPLPNPARESPATSEKIEKRIAEPPAKAEKPVSEPPKPAPIVLSASTGRAATPESAKEPIAAPLPIAGLGSMSNVALPSTSSAAPRLAASAVSQRSGGNLLKRVNPIYPQRARSMGLQGVVEVRVKVGKNGSVAEVRRTSGNAILGEAAIDAVRKWQYEPMLLNGQPVEFEANVSLKFETAK